MACFLVPAAEAVVIAAAERQAEVRETDGHGRPAGIPLSRKLRWLRNLLLGGAVLLAFEHVWHGEVTPWFPFLTAMSTPADTAAMLQEMATVGVCMAALITAVWAAMCAAAERIVRRPDAPEVRRGAAG